MQKGNFFLKPIYSILKEAREQKGLTLEDVHRDTKIHHRILKAMEEGSAIDLSPVYLRSYIKLYAHYLGIDKAEIDRYFLSEDQNKRKDTSQINKSVVPMGSIDGRESRLSNFSFQLNPKNIISVFLVLFFLFMIFKFIGRPKPVDGQAQESTASSEAVKEPVPQAVREVKAAASAVTQGVPDVLRLTIFAEEDTWMQIKSDGNIVFKRILKKAASDTWQAKESFELWLANAGTVKLELNGKIMPPIGRRGQLLKSVIITKDGFKVNR